MAGKAASSQYTLRIFYRSLADLLDKELPLAGVVLCFTSILPEQRVSY